MYTFLDNMFKVLKVAANNGRQKDLAALTICGNNLEAIDVLQRLHQYCLNIGDLQHAEEISARDSDAKMRLVKRFWKRY